MIDQRRIKTAAIGAAVLSAFAAAIPTPSLAKEDDVVVRYMVPQCLLRGPPHRAQIAFNRDRQLQ